MRIRDHGTALKGLLSPAPHFRCDLHLPERIGSQMMEATRCEREFSINLNSKHSDDGARPGLLEATVSVDHVFSILCGFEQTSRVQRSRLAVFALGHIENDGVGVELRRGVPVDGPRGVVLEGRGGEFAGQLRGVHVPESSLCVPLQFPRAT